MSEIDFIYKRKSVRKFLKDDVPIEDIEKMLSAAAQAPSGKNAQNWHYVIIKNKALIEGIADAIETTHDSIVAAIGNPEQTSSFSKFLRYYTLFRGAPVLVAVYYGEYLQTEIELLESIGWNDAAKRIRDTSSGIQNVAASLENFMLAASSMGYGTCWMTGPSFASIEVEKKIGFEKEGYKLMAVTPLGVPDGDMLSPKRRAIEEIYSLIE